jgi:ABC-type dipeptide/oligopeptide/nickel transport system ATPase component
MNAKTNNETMKQENMAEIIKHLSLSVIKHDKIAEGYRLIEDTINNNQFINENQHAVIIGESGCGKSTLMDLYQSENCPTSNEFQLGIRRDVPAIFSSVPSPVTPKSMSVELLKSLGDTSGLNQTARQLTDRLVHHIQHSNIKVIFLDECQHLLSLGSQNKNQTISGRLRESIDWIKSLTNKTNTTIVLLGMPELLDIIKADFQLARRFTNTHYLCPFNEPDESNDVMVKFADNFLLDASEITFDADETNYFTEIDYFCDNPEHAERLFLATEGNPSKIKALIIKAVCTAYDEGSHHIQMAHFEKAFQKLEQASIEAKKAARLELKRKAKKVQRQDDSFQNPFSLPMNEVQYLIHQEAV